MPSAIRLAGLVVFAIMTWIVSEQVKPLFPEGMAFGRFSIYNAMLGGVIGWVFMSPRVTERRAGALNAGITTAVAVVFWVLLFHSIREMITLSLRKQYDGPVEAVVGVFQILLDYGVMIATPTILITLVIFAVFGGMFCGGVGRRWP